ncbi:MAG: hypothetical protein ACRDGB_09840 [Candidatus Limnocylindria bacterium]
MLAVALTACSPTPLEPGTLSLSRSALGVPLDQDAAEGLQAAAVMSFSLASDADRQLNIVSIEPVTDDGLEVEYLGFSSCRRGCAGTGLWTAEKQRQVESGLEGHLPVLVMAEEAPPHLTFVLRVPSETAVHALEGSCLRLLGIDVALDDGTSVFIASHDGEYVAGLWAEGFAECEL